MARKTELEVKRVPRKSSAKKAAAPTPFRIGFLVHDVSRMRRTLFDQAVKPIGLTRSQWWVLANLSRYPSSDVMQSELARNLDVGKVTVGGLLDRLEASGHIERRPDASDRRARRVFITPKGYEIIREMTAIGQKLNKVILQGISKDDVRIAEDVLHTMKYNLRRSLNGGSPSDQHEVE